MTRIRLVKLSVAGSDVSPSDIDFSPGLTVVHGASNTGKSYILDLLDYLLGRKAIRQIVDAEPYDTASLSFLSASYPEGATLVRPLRGEQTPFGFYTGESRPSRPRRLSVNHSANSGNNASSVLLAEIGLADKWVRTNANNEINSLSFRNVSPLVIVNETSIISEVPAAISGNPIQTTREQSVLKVLLQGNDDSDLPRVPRSAGAERERNVGRRAALEQVAAEIRLSLAGGEDVQTLTERRDRLQAAIDEATEALVQYSDRQTYLLQLQREIREEANRHLSRLAEVDDLVASFELLSRKYDSDLDRLGLLEEAGTLLGYFQVGNCVFCGAALEHQSVREHQVEDRTLFAESVRAEQEKTRALRQDLAFAIGDLVSERQREESSLEALSFRESEAVLALRQLDDRLAPQRLQIRELVESKGGVERRLAAFEQVEIIDVLRSTIPVTIDTAALVPSVITDDTARDFATLLAEILSAWGIPELRSVSFDTSTTEISMNGVPRATHGKGMRAILHAAFTVGLAQWCIERELPHPGFVVLDSPLLTYKEPEDSRDAGLIESNVADHFFHYLDTSFKGQAVVLENIAPPAQLSKRAKVYEFTKADHGRYGLFPHPVAG